MKTLSVQVALMLYIAQVSTQEATTAVTINCITEESPMCIFRKNDCEKDLKVSSMCPKTCGLCGATFPPMPSSTPTTRLTSTITSTPSTTTKASPTTTKTTPTTPSSTTGRITQRQTTTTRPTQKPETSTPSTSTPSSTPTSTTKATTTEPFKGNLTLSVSIRNISDTEIEMIIYTYGKVYPSNLTSTMLTSLDNLGIKNAKVRSQFYTHGYAGNNREEMLSKLEWYIVLATRSAKEASDYLTGGDKFGAEMEKEMSSTPVTLYKKGDFTNDPVRYDTMALRAGQGYVWTNTDTIVLASVLAGLALIILIIAAVIAYDRRRHKKKLEVASREKLYHGSHRF